MASINIGESEAQAIRVERYIKKRKSASFNKKCIDQANDLDFIDWLISKSNS